MTDFHPSIEQDNAVELCCDPKNRIVCVTGGAGTGKTTTLKGILDYLTKDLQYEGGVALCAPTGRAAKRIQEATGYPAKTIHRLLEFPVPTELEDKDSTEIVFGRPKRNAEKPLQQKMVFVDEASMMGPTIHKQLMDALPNDGSIRFFGDINQLPPVDNMGELKSPFLDALSRYETIILTRNFRSDDNLIVNANRILVGRIPQRGEKFEMIVTRDPISTLKEIAQLEYSGLDHQILTPMRKNKTGAVRLSAMLRTKFAIEMGMDRNTPYLQLPRFNEDEQELPVVQGDKVLWTKNDYYLNVMNGELGLLTRLDQHDGEIELTLEDRHVRVPPLMRGFMGNFYDPRRAIDLAYVMTVHKAQGSEFDSVIYVMSRGNLYMASRNNFYTAVTRAKKKVILITDQTALNASLRKVAIPDVNSIVKKRR